MTTSDRTTPIGANCAVVTANHKSGGWNFLKGISTVSALLEHSPVKSDIGINVRGFKDEVVPECQLRCESFKENKGWRVQPFITNHSRSSMNAAFGDVSAGGVGTPLLEVTQSGGGPSALVANQPCGNAGGVTPSKFSLRVLRPKHGPHLPVRISALIGRIANRPMPAAMRKRRKPRFRNAVRVNVRFRLASIAAKLQLVFSTEALRPCQSS